MFGAFPLTIHPLVLHLDRKIAYNGTCPFRRRDLHQLCELLEKAFAVSAANLNKVKPYLWYSSTSSGGK